MNTTERLIAVRTLKASVKAHQKILNLELKKLDAVNDRERMFLIKGLQKDLRIAKKLIAEAEDLIPS